MKLPVNKGQMPEGIRVFKLLLSSDVSHAATTILRTQGVPFRV
jgi:hypothetical protein